ncbi:MAG: AAA family ATPase [Methylococcaceae bacterium]|nr:AAA family ATPase [Methylococcaceae bacterium]
MSSSFFFLQATQNQINKSLIEQISNYSNAQKKQVYIINKPLGDNKYSYDYEDCLVLLIPRHKIIFIDFGANKIAFESFVEDFIEDLGSISDKYRYKQIIGRPKYWRDDLIEEYTYDQKSFQLKELLTRTKIQTGDRQKVCELLISLLTGSINDIDKVKVKGTVPDNLLDKVKQKILLFDGDQTRFVYQQTSNSVIRIQGLSGTGKTELLLHKLKELYVGSESSKIMFTCHNKILADNLKKRIPDFFNFMKVEQQIKWSERLWCVNAWGSQNDKNSGAYSYICVHYGLPFYRFSYSKSFDSVCRIVLNQLNEKSEVDFAFDYMLIDESQDFPQSFFDLCEKVTRYTVYIAGDIFQSIFDENIVSNIEPDFLLSKCYRTDPRTLMFAHSLGMGLFETPKLRWLEDKEWEACGYLVEKIDSETRYRLSRESLRRFEDLGNESFDSVEIVLDNDVYNKILTIIKDIIDTNPTVLADDVGIIFTDNSKITYLMADALEQSIPRAFGWNVNKAYESKHKIKDTLFISNKNNVKGLEFPFVICVTGSISRSYAARNALYMMLTRSFIKTYLLISQSNTQSLIKQIQEGLVGINTNQYIEVVPPSKEEIEKIKTTIKYSNSSMSFFDFIASIFNELGVDEACRTSLFDTVKNVIGEDFDKDRAQKVIEFNYKEMRRD